MTTNIIKVDRVKILQNLANNLNVNILNENSSVFRIGTPIINELESFAQYANRALSEMQISSASYPTLQQIGAELGIYRKVYNLLEVYKSDQVLEIRVDPNDELSTISDTLLFNIGDRLSLSGFTIVFTDQVRLANSTSIVYASARLLLDSRDSISIEKDSVYSVTPTNNTEIVYRAELAFRKSVSVVNIAEEINDYRLRLVNAKSGGTRTVNNILTNVIQEVPGILYYEVDNYLDGVGVEAVYIYTNKLLTEGADDYIDRFLVPAVTSSIEEKLDNTSVELVISSAKPLNIILNIKSSLNLGTDLDSVKIKVNALLADYNTLDISTLLNLVNTTTQVTVQLQDISMALKSESIFEDPLDVTETVIEKPVGRFFYLVGIVGV